MDTPTPDPDASAWRAILRRLDRIDRRLDRLGAPTPDDEDDEPVLPPPIRRRRVTLLDLMTLVAFTALALPAYRVLPGVVEDSWVDPRGLEQILVSMFIGWAFLTPAGVALTLATALLRRIGPRPRPRALSRQPGAFGVTVASLLLITVVPLHLAIASRLVAMPDPGDFLFYGMIGCPKVVGGAVAGIWLTLWASGRFDPPADWVDGLGRALCVYWLIAATFNVPLF